MHARARPAALCRAHVRQAYPLFVTLGAAVGVCAFQCTRCLFFSPDVRINKDDRAAGVLDNFKEGANFKVRKGGVQMKEGREMGRGARAFKGQLPAPKEERAFGLGGVLPPKRSRNTAGGGQGVGERIARELFKS